MGEHRLRVDVDLGRRHAENRRALVHFHDARLFQCFVRLDRVELLLALLREGSLRNLARLAEGLIGAIGVLRWVLWVHFGRQDSVSLAVAHVDRRLKIVQEGGLRPVVQLVDGHVLGEAFALAVHRLLQGDSLG